MDIQESDYSESYCINDNNEVLGAYRFGGKKYTFIWNQEKGMRLIDFPNEARPIKMNIFGQIIGYFEAVKNNERGSYFVWDEINGITKITIDASCTDNENFTVVKDINDKGVIIGLFYKKNTRGSFIWENGQYKF